MSRPVNESLEYINIDVNFFDDIKILFVSERFSEKGELIAIKILLWIYRQGYYTQWNEEIAMLFAKKNFKNVSFELVNDVIGELLKRGFLNEEMFKSFGILTSNGIQKRWFEIVTKAKRKCSIKPEFNLLIPKIREETPAKQVLTPPERVLTPPERAETTQSKVKESKVNKEYKEKIFPTMPKAEDVGELPKAILEKYIESVGISQYVIIDEETVLSLWEIFKTENLTGKNYHPNIEAVYTFFLRTAKYQKFHKSATVVPINQKKSVVI
jgi:rRNA maturation endonuclease Nob1